MKTTPVAYRSRLATTTAACQGTPPPGPAALLRPYALPTNPPAFWQNYRLLEFGRPA